MAHLGGLFRKGLSERQRSKLMAKFEHFGSEPADTPLKTEAERFFWQGKHRPTRKWHHYLPIYDELLSRFRGTPVRMLEIGVRKGGSLDLWRSLLGQDAVIYGIDIDPSCSTMSGPDAQVRIGSQTDPDFLASVVKEMGGLDIVVDDGSHIAKDIVRSLDVLFPHLSETGLYLIEDLHTSYWRKFASQGPFGSNVLRLVNDMIADMHCHYHNMPTRHAPTAGWITGIRVYDSILVLEKGKMRPPRHTGTHDTRLVATAASTERNHV